MSSAVAKSSCDVEKTRTTVNKVHRVNLMVPLPPAVVTYHKTVR